MNLLCPPFSHSFKAFHLFGHLNSQLSHGGDSPDFGGQGLLEAPLQVLHVGGFGPGDEGRAPLLCDGAGRAVGGDGGGRRQLLGQLAAQPVESLVYLAVVLAGGHFVERAAQRSREHGTLLGVDAPQVQQVCLIRQQDDRRHIGTTSTDDQLVQLIDQVEAAAIGHRVHKHHSIGPLDGAGHVLR